MPTIWQAGAALLTRDLRLVWRRRGDSLQPVMFAVLVVALFVLALGSEPTLLPQIAFAVLWLAVLLAGLLTLDSMFRSDAEDGTLEQWLLSPVPLTWLVAVRVFSHWLTTAFPVIIAAPFLGELLHLPRNQLPILLLSLLLGTPLLSLIGSVVAALTVGMRRAGVLMALLALPLYVPVLVFGAGSVAISAQGLDPTAALLLLAGGLVICSVLTPLATAAAIRLSLS